MFNLSRIKTSIEPRASKLSQLSNLSFSPQLSASTIWGLFATDMKNALEEHEQLRLCKSSTYLNCHFR